LPNAARSADAVVAIVLAAGASSRFDGQKLLADVRGKPMIRHTVESALRSGVDRVRVVVGADAESVREALRGLTVETVLNEDYRRGQGRSIAVGISDLPAGADAAIIMLGDQPDVSPALVDELIHTYREGDASIVLAEFDGERSPPVLFGRDVFDELAALDGDQGARSVVSRLPERVKTITVRGPVPRDVDTREDHRALLERDRGGGFAD